MNEDQSQSEPRRPESGQDQSAYNPAWSQSEYEELRVLARAALRKWGERRPVDTTELVHESYLRFSDQRNQHWGSEAQYYAAMVVMIRRALVDAARSRNAQKRGGGRTPSQFHENCVSCDGLSFPVIELDEMIRLLGKHDELLGDVASWRLFGGFGLDRIAELKGVSKSTIERRWRIARAWLVDQLEAE